MTDEPFGRQLKRVNVSITGGDPEDRAYWANKITGYLNHQPCVTFRGTSDTWEYIDISPDANND